MSNIIKSEMFRSLRSCYFRLCFFGGALLMGAGMIFLPEIAEFIGFHLKTADDLNIVLPFVLVAVAVALMVIFPMFTDIFKYDTYKNNPPALLCLQKAKYAAVLIFMLFYAAVFTISLSVCIIRLTPEGSSPVGDILSCCGRFLATVPNYMAIIAFIQLLAVSVRNETASIVVYYFIIPQMFTVKLFINAVFSNSGDTVIHLTPVGELYNLGCNISPVQTVISVVVGIAYTAVLIAMVQKFYKKRVFE